MGSGDLSQVPWLDRGAEKPQSRSHLQAPRPFHRLHSFCWPEIRLFLSQPDRWMLQVGLWQR